MTTELHKKPGYFAKYPIFTEIKKMKKSIGLQDSCLQTNEVSILYLEEKANESTDKEDFIKDLCKKYNVSLGIRDFDQFKKTLYKSYILQTYNLVEPFFKKLNRKYLYYNNLQGDWKTKNSEGKNLDPLNQLLANLPKEKAKELKSYPEFHLLNYYRLIRNSIVHLQEYENEHDKTNEFYKNNIEQFLHFFSENYEIEAPKEPEKIIFLDYLLYTKSIKYFANIVNDIIFPSIENIVTVAQSDLILQQRLKNYADVKNEKILLNRINCLRRFFRYHFNINHKELQDNFCRTYLRAEGIDYSRYL